MPDCLLLGLIGGQRVWQRRSADESEGEEVNEAVAMHDNLRQLDTKMPRAGWRLEGYIVG